MQSLRLGEVLVVEMASVMSTGNDGGVQFPPPDRRNDAVGEDRTGGSTGAGAAVRVEFNAVVSGERAAPASLVAGDNGSSGTRVWGNVDDPRVLKLGNKEKARGDAGGWENQVSSSDSGMHESTKQAVAEIEIQEHESLANVMVNRSSIMSDYNSFLSAFDEFAAKAKGEAVGHGYYIGDMVWGKVKSHPWWPGQIYNEALASPSVRRSKHAGQVLVAFFGDSSYGWFDPAEFIPFEENFAEKSRQTTSRAFLNAVEEGVDEVSRRKVLGLACRCRNKNNFRPSSVEGNFVVDVGDNEPGVYGWSQINKSQDSFQPWEMYTFMEQLALQPMNHQFGVIDFIKNKATVLACRKAWFEEFDPTYSQAFGSDPVHPPRPSTPVVLDPLKAPLSGPLVIAEALGQGKISVKRTKMKDQIEKDKYLFKRRDEPIQIKGKKASLGQAGPSPHLASIDGIGYSSKVIHSSTSDNMPSEFTITYSQHQPKTHQASMTSEIRHSEGVIRHIEGGKQKIKVQKRPVGELNAALVEKQKKKKRMAEVETETVRKFRHLPLAVSDSTIKVENASGTPPRVPLMDAKLENPKSDPSLGSFSSIPQLETDFGKLELQMMVKDLRGLALNPFHGMKRSCPAVILQVFLKYRSLVYQESLALSPTTEQDVSERTSSKYPAASVSIGPAEKATEKKILKPVVRIDDPTKGGKKRGPVDRLEDVKIKKLDLPEEIKKKKKVDDSWDTKKKKIDDPRLLAPERKILQRPVVSQKENAAAKNALAAPSKAAKLETGHGNWTENASIAPRKIVKQEPGNRMEGAARNAPAVQPKSSRPQSSTRTGLQARVPIPTMLIMKFPPGAKLPSNAELKAKFARFGQMDHSSTRVFWPTTTCRLVFLYKADAEAALKFARGSSNLFGTTNVKSYIKERDVEAGEQPEPSKIQKNVTQARDNAVEQRIAATAQLKSCLKKPAGDEVGYGNERGSRVKFVLSRDENVKDIGEPSIDESENRVGSSAQPPESVTKILPNVITPNHMQLLRSEARPRPMTNIRLAEHMAGRPVIDISQEMVILLRKCDDVVSNLRNILGYMPYHPL